MLELFSKMKLSQYRIHYSRDFKIALGISLSIIILTFIFFPDNNTEQNDMPIYDSTLFTINDVPPTIQISQTQQAAAKIHPTPAIQMPSDIGEPEILSDVKITGTNTKTNPSSGTGNAGVSKNSVDSSIPLVPRQILEVMPKKVDKNVEGYIKLSLKIGVNGKVESYIVISNTTDCSECLQNVLVAVHKSIWQPARVAGKNIEYWVEKSYNFN